MQRTSFVLLGVFILGMACGKKDDDPAAEGTGTALDEPQDILELTVDASSKDNTVWRYFDFETGTDFGEDGKANDTDWDLAFQRFKIKSNGGVSGTAGVTIARVTTPFDELTTAPADGYSEDQADGDDADTDPDYVFLQDGGWYDYDPVKHTLNPKELVYVIKTPSGNAYKLALTGYYDEAGTPGMLRIKWQKLAAATTLHAQGGQP